MSNINIYKKQGGNVMVFGSGSIPVGVALSKKFSTLKVDIDFATETVLLPALDGYKYRIVDIVQIATAANSATATAVTVSGTQTTAAILVSNTVGALTRSAIVAMGVTANSTVLADGASFDACDDNTAITLSCTVADLTGAGDIDTIITYVIEEA